MHRTSTRPKHFSFRKLVVMTRIMLEMKKSITSCFHLSVLFVFLFEHLQIADLMMLHNVTWRMIEVINITTWNLCCGSISKSGMRKAPPIYLLCASATCIRSLMRCCEFQPPSSRIQTPFWWWKSCGSVEYSWSRAARRLCSSGASQHFSHKDVSLRKGKLKSSDGMLCLTSHEY